MKLLEKKSDDFFLGCVTSISHETLKHRRGMKKIEVLEEETVHIILILNPLKILTRL